MILKTLFFKLVTDSRVVMLFLAISTLTYIHFLQIRNESLEDKIVTLEEDLQESRSNTSQKERELSTLEQVLTSDCQERVDIILKNKVEQDVLVCEVEKTKDLKVVEEKNILGSTLPENILQALRGEL